MSFTAIKQEPVDDEIDGESTLVLFNDGMGEEENYPLGVFGEIRVENLPPVESDESDVDEEKLRYDSQIMIKEESIIVKEEPTILDPQIMIKEESIIVKEEPTLLDPEINVMCESIIKEEPTILTDYETQQEPVPTLHCVKTEAPVFPKRRVQGTFQCEACSLSFVTAHLLHSHKCSVLQRSKDYVCPICKAVYGSSNDLLSHVSRAHILDQKPSSRPKRGRPAAPRGRPAAPRRYHVCPICKASFYSHNALVLHVSKMHVRTQGPPSPQKTYVCPICKTAVATNSDLLDHVASLHLRKEKLLPCPTCGKAFKRKGLLTEHMSSHATGFSDCRQSTPLRRPRGGHAALKEHMRVHEGTLSFACKLCRKVFVDKPSDHAKLHAQGLPLN